MENWRLSQTRRCAEYTNKDAYEAYRNSRQYREDLDYYYSE